MTDRPLILVTNDDGILSDGLRVLAEAAARFGDVLVVAPEREMSAVSHAITLHRPIRVQRLDEARYALSGTPVDCVYIGTHKLAPRRPTLVVSGVNRGPNLGGDTLYSGTVAGAREGTIQGLAAIAFSLTSRTEAVFEPLRPVIERVIEEVLTHGLPPELTINVNIPANPGAHPVFECTRLGRASYVGEVVARLDPRGKEYLWIGGGVPELDDTPGTDTACARGGSVSVTPLSLFEVRAEHVAAVAAWPLFDGRAPTK